MFKIGSELNDFNSVGNARDWNGKKAGSLELYNLAYDADIYTSGQLERLAVCGDFLKYGITSNGKMRLVRANFCKIRLCPLCNWRRTLKLYNQISNIMNNVANYCSNKLTYLFVTLTIKNCVAEELSDTIDRLNKGFSKMIVSKGYANTLKKNTVGFLRCIEVTYNSNDKTYHPHIHAILAVKQSYFDGKNYLTKQKVSELWSRYIKVDYNASIDIKVVKNYDYKSVSELAKYPAKIYSVFKLATKTEQLEVISNLKKSLHSRRLIVLGGLFKQIQQDLKMSDVETDTDLINTDYNTENEAFINYATYRYGLWGGGYRYGLSRISDI